MNLFRRQLLLAASLLTTHSAWGQSDYPRRPIKIISPTAPGSGGDALVRRVSEPLARLLGQPVIVENRPGAQSALGARIVAKAPNDGYTLLLGGNSFLANAHMMKDLGYDPIQDFTPISLMVHNPLMLAVNADLPVRTLEEFIAYAKQRPGQLNFGVGNTGSLIAASLLTAQAGLKAVAVNYPGMAQAANDLVAGRVHFLMLDPVIAASFIQAGRLRVLGISSAKRSPSFPDVAPLAELGLPGYEWVGWVGLFGPAKLPQAITQRLNQAVIEVIADPGVRQFIGQGGMIPATTTPEELQAHMHAQMEAWGRWTKQAGLQPV